MSHFSRGIIMIKRSLAAFAAALLFAAQAAHATPPMPGSPTYPTAPIAGMPSTGNVAQAPAPVPLTTLDKLKAARAAAYAQYQATTNRILKALLACFIAAL